MGQSKYQPERHLKTSFVMVFIGMQSKSEAYLVERLLQGGLV